MASFQAKIRGENGNKNYRSVQFQPDAKKKFPKK